MAAIARLEQLPEWWNDLIGWFLSARPNRIGPNMVHAWRVNRFADSTCNGGMANALQRRNAASRLELLESMSIVCDERHVEILEKGLALIKDRKPRVPRVAFIASQMAFDSFMRGHTREMAIEAMASTCPECPPEHHQAALAAGLYEFELLNRWEAVDKPFYAQEPSLRLCIATYAQQHMSEWRKQ